MTARAGAAAVLLAVAAAAMPARAGDWRVLLEHAWSARAPLAAARLAQGAAQRDAASAVLPQTPTLTLAGRGDRVDPRRGAREWEAELAAPLWWPGQRERSRGVADAEQALRRAALERARWQLAGELREAVWALRLARAEAAAGEARRAQADRLADDVARRVQAGDLAPLDQHQARAAVAAARAEAERSAAAQRAAERHFDAVARGAPLPGATEDAPTAVPAEHPQLAELDARRVAARAHLAQTEADRRDAPELALSVTRERDAPAQPWLQRARLALRVPLGAQVGAGARQAAATAELAEADWALDQARRQLGAAQAAAQSELDALHRAEAALAERAGLSRQSLDWVEQAFRAGQLDAPALWRAAAEHADAQWQAERARLDAARARSRLNQALGVMP